MYDCNVSYGSINVLLGPLDVVEPQKLLHSRIWGENISITTLCCAVWEALSQGFNSPAKGKKPLGCGSLYMTPLVDVQGQETEAVCVPL